MDLTNLGCFSEPFIALAYESFNGYIFTALLELGVDPFVKIDGNRNLFDAKWYDYLRGETEGMEHHLAALLNFGARIDVKDPRTQRTAFELALRAAENSDCPNPQPLQFLLEHVVPSTLTCKYIYETLDSQIEDLEGHIKSSILIMQHGWISEKARSFVFDWLVSYNTFSSVREGLHIKNEDHWLNQKAARFFPRFLTRQQLDLLWEKSRASYAATDQSRRNHNLYYVLERWYSMPWWLINAERGDVEAMKLLAEWEHPRTDPDWLFGDDSERFILAGNDGGHTPLMRAIATGSKDVAMWLLEANNGAVRGSFNCHHFRESVSDDPEDDSEDEVEGFECDLCPYGQRTAYEIAVHRGEVELLEIMWDLELDEVKWEEYIAMPRVFSYSNVMVEWMQLKLGTKRWMKLEMSGQDAWLRNEISKKLAKLRIEIVEIREAWRAQAKAFESRGMGIVEAS
ncbi:hypothetical protein PFICI_13048 [Pestalotiopsis fici W106-1]|uniref:Ankyrin n=1 Tax=Pestalotiopsis fici (strain W106-1 / CGMCC3.15140) TaxID=1229662 RepID=W3WLC6_PESFW|nr:uncharacterized protein PFICI_13048 [Pestalotiopsis fici W106-1]ETS74564.1 hypothetical protein PFICI_13048 [Pestalotiopsis fici W106-1]